VERVVLGGDNSPSRARSPPCDAQKATFVFLQETRDYDELERLWSDVPRVEWVA
jgi:hypothetical protein